MLKSTKYKICSGLMSGGVVAGIALVTTFLPSSEWVTTDQAQIGAIIGITLLVICVPSATWLWVRTFKIRGEESKELNSIKNDLTTIDKYERDVAVEQAKNKYSSNIKTRIKQDVNELYSIPTIENIIKQAQKNNIDPLVDFFKNFGNILDANNCGLKIKLQNIPEYNTTSSNITSKAASLHYNRKKITLIQGNIDRLLKGGYGLSSGIVLRGILKASPPKNKEENAATHSVVISLEGLETIGWGFLAYGLNHLDTKWKPKFKKKQINTPQTQTMFNQVSQLNKSKFERLHTLKSAIDKLRK